MRNRAATHVGDRYLIVYLGEFYGQCLTPLLKKETKKSFFNGSKWKFKKEGNYLIPWSLRTYLSVVLKSALSGGEQIDGDGIYFNEWTILFGSCFFFILFYFIKSQ